MDWIQSIQRSLNYIESHLLDEDLDNETVAEQAYSSNANFQRIFSIVTGFTIADYIRCRKLTLAGNDLINPDVKVIDTALKYGYDTPESFSKSFVRFHGIIPSEVKNNPGSLKCFAPIFLRTEIRGGFNMNTKMVPHITKVFFNRGGENYHFNSAVRYVMECFGETELADYSLIAGITGDFYTQFYSYGGFRGDSASDLYLDLESVFDKIGYDALTVSVDELHSNKEHFIKRITDSIDRGTPVIWRHGGPTGVLVGYEDNGNTVLYLRKEMEEPERLVLDENLFINNPLKPQHGGSIIIAGNKKREVSLKQLYRDAIIQMPKLLTKKTYDYVFGAEAFRAWANDIENGRYEQIGVDFFTYEVYVLCLATNSGGCQEFFEKAQELNPDFAFLEDVRKQYRITNYLWNSGYWGGSSFTQEEREDMIRLYGTETLETLGGAFGCKLETLQDKEKLALIVKQIRRFADCIDEVVRILNENLI